MLKPDFDFDYLGLPIYNIMAALGVALALILLLRCENNVQLSVKQEEKLNASAIIAAVCGLACANIANWFFFADYAFSLPLLERIQQSGLTFYYGMFGFFAMFALMLRIWHLDVGLWINKIVPSVLIFHAFGRIGCSLAGCCYGVVLDPPFRLLGIELHLFPARELEAFSLFVMFLLFEFKIKEHSFALYLICYSILRFFLEFGRGDARGQFIFEALSPAQVSSILVWIGLLAWWIVRHFTTDNRRSHSLSNS